MHLKWDYLYRLELFPRLRPDVREGFHRTTESRGRRPARASARGTAGRQASVHAEARQRAPSAQIREWI